MARKLRALVNERRAEQAVATSSVKALAASIGRVEPKAEAVMSQAETKPILASQALSAGKEPQAEPKSRLASQALNADKKPQDSRELVTTGKQTVLVRVKVRAPEQQVVDIIAVAKAAGCGAGDVMALAAKRAVAETKIIPVFKPRNTETITSTQPAMAAKVNFFVNKEIIAEIREINDPLGIRKASDLVGGQMELAVWRALNEVIADLKTKFQLSEG